MPPQQEDVGREGGVNDAMGSRPDIWVGRGGGRGGGGSASLPERSGGDEMGGEVLGGDVAVSGVDSLQAATAKLHLGDGVSDGGDDGRGDRQEGHNISRVGDDKSDHDYDDGLEEGRNRERTRERELQPKFGLKVLVPGATAGCLIGKAGRIITQLQTTTGTRVKLSQKDEFFPGTHDRVALVQGEDPTRVAEAVAEMLRRLKEAARPNPNAPQEMGGFSHGGGFGGGGGGGLSGSHDRNGQVTIRLLVPLAAGGLIIGRGGETVKAIGERTGARVNLAGKDADVAGVPSERLCSIQGDLESAIKVIFLIVEKMAEDRGLSRYQSNQTCYQTGPSAGGPSTVGGDGGSVDGSTHHQHQHHLMGASGSSSSSSSNIHAFMPLQGSWGSGIRGPGSSIGFGGGGGQQGGAQGHAMGVGGGATGPDAGLGPIPAGPGGQGHLMGSSYPASAGGGSPGLHAVGGGGGLGVQQQVGLGRGQGMMVGGVFYGYPYPGMQPQGFSQGNMGMRGVPSMYSPYGADMPIVMAVPDSIVGVILGKNGATVIEMQDQTGARIQVSQRGDFIPGTRNRSVTISGTQQAVASARTLVYNLCSQAAQNEFRTVPRPSMQQHQQYQQNQHQHQHQPPFY